MIHDKKIKKGLRIGLTGGIGCGKSTVAKYLRAAGYPVLDTDDVSHRLIQKGQAIHDKVVKIFGAGILNANGDIDRRVLGRIVFEDESKLEILNGIIHPAVIAETKVWLSRQDEMSQVAVVIVPLLYEINLTSLWDMVICVAAADAPVRERLRLRGWSDEEINLRLSRQLPVEMKRQKADFVVNNNGSLEDLNKQIDTTMNAIFKRRQDYGRRTE